MDSAFTTERRKFERSKVTPQSAAITFDDDKFPILEMSSGGFSVICSRGESIPLGSEWHANILVHGGTLLRNVPVRMAWSKKAKESSGTSSLPTLGVEFQQLRKSQKLQIEAFLKWHTGLDS